MKNILIKFKGIIVLSLCILVLFVGCNEERDQLEVNDNLAYYDSRVTFSGNRYSVYSGAALLSTDVTVPNDIVITGYGHCWINQNRAPSIADSKTSFGQTSLKSFTIYSTINNYSYNYYYERAYIMTAQGIIYDKTYRLQ